MVPKLMVITAEIFQLTLKDLKDNKIPMISCPFSFVCFASFDLILMPDFEVLLGYVVCSKLIKSV